MKRKIIVFLIIGLIALNIAAYISTKTLFKKSEINNNFSIKEYENLKNNARELIINSRKYQELEGHRLEYIHKDSDIGQLKCNDCDGFSFVFLDSNELAANVRVIIKRQADGEIMIDNAEIFPAKSDTYYNIINDQDIFYDKD